MAPWPYQPHGSLGTPSRTLSPARYRMQGAFTRTAGSLPALPQLGSWAAAVPAQVPTQPFRVSLSCGSVAGQISTEHITPTELAQRHGVAQGIALCIHDAAVTADGAASQVRWSWHYALNLLWVPQGPYLELQIMACLAGSRTATHIKRGLI